MPLAVLEALLVQCNVCASVCTFVQAKKVKTGGFSMRACKEENGSLLKRFSHSWGYVNILRAPGAPTWHVHKPTGGQGWMQRVVVAGFLAEH